ncbi:AbrB/MazE/SpoVT family DNA-binding domain-containing protein [Mesorhizobium sp. LHD-90]|uniref:AbrB/MazE/SpoVT family DNA-binding domain-containing protein n=1 Tax=Mesorhizobium sp. LHD-90 TaxID=3071414 RepID=UPI0027DF71CF|nr:AbrB/MazE/SpoVT family DNA-binding domain-containing protein [Mesorhizobium sp. LHD-90]MDQ6436945.1 AbrB/MazE/SpoVT family DNA-binding domain-containing protein [Mesorhizobium sp. LHD-90]
MSGQGFGESPQTPYDAAAISAEAGPQSVAYVRLKVDNAGRIVIPAEMRAAMLIKPGDTVTAQVVDGEFRIVSPGVALKRVQAFARKWRAEHPNENVVDELIAERREEARREDERYARLEREAAALDTRNRGG